MSNRAFQRRAMTLIEVLAATVLLAILSSVCASLLRTMPAMPTAVSRDAAPIDILALERVADQLLDEEGLRDRLNADSSADFTAEWPDEAGHPPVRIRRIDPGTSGDVPVHAWVAFSCGELTAWRYLKMPEEILSP